MQIIEGVLFEPVGCLAEFPSEPFHEIAVCLFDVGRRKKPSKSGSRAYWHFLNLMEAADRKLDESQSKVVEALEMEAVAGASAYEDVIPALIELKAMGVKLLLATSLSSRAVTLFLEKCALQELFSAVWNRDNSGGIKAAPLSSAIEAACLEPAQAMFLTDTTEGPSVAKRVGVNSILMMNDPDEAR